MPEKNRLIKRFKLRAEKTIYSGMRFKGKLCDHKPFKKSVLEKVEQWIFGKAFNAHI